MYRRLVTVADAFRNVGAKHIDDFWIKDKYIDCMMPFEPLDVKTLVGREIFPSLTSNKWCTSCKLSRWPNKTLMILAIVPLGCQEGPTLPWRSIPWKKWTLKNHIGPLGACPIRRIWNTTTMTIWHSMQEPFGLIHPKQRKKTSRETKQVGSRARAQVQDLASVVVTSSISSPNAPMSIEKLMVEGSFPRTRAKIQRFPTREHSSRIRRTRCHQGLCY